MPYYVYQIGPQTGSAKKQLTHLATYEDFKAARALVRDRRVKAGAVHPDA